MPSKREPKRGTPLPAEAKDLPKQWIQDVVVDARNAFIETKGRAPKQIVVHMSTGDALPYGMDVLGFRPDQIGRKAWVISDEVQIYMSWNIAMGRYSVRCS